jgi:uncharacterized protein
MNLEQKLQSIRQHVALDPPQSEHRPVARATRRHDWAARLDGELEPIGSTGSFCVTSRFTRSHTHGLHRFSTLSRMSGSALSVVCRDPELSFADISQAVFLDTETTGLNMGTGTYVFLVGAGYMHDGEFVVRQFFLDSPGEETAFLDALYDFLSPFPVLVTFNGKAFDLPLLDSRFHLHRRETPFDDPPHVDLLHSSRRLWKRRLESCALSALEREVLGVTRTKADVSGWEIPLQYFRYQRSGDGTPLEGVFYHNLMDILSLATLAVHIDRVVADPSCGLAEHPVDFFCIGKVYELSGDGEMAVFCYDEAMRRGLSGDVRQDCLLRLGTIHKRARRHDAAILAWELLLDEGGRSALVARVELAKFHEHVERDYVAAIDHVQQALALAELHRSPWPDANQRDLEHRLSRLLNRSIRERSWSATYR